MTGSRITVIDASEHALGLNTPSRDTAPTKDHLKLLSSRAFRWILQEPFANTGLGCLPVLVVRHFAIIQGVQLKSGPSTKP